MIICWNNLDKLTYDIENGFWLETYYFYRVGRKSIQKSILKYEYVDECVWCKEPFLSLINNKGRFCCKSCGVSHKQTGKPSGMSGKKHSMETRKKISKSNTGKIRTIGMRKKYSVSKKGKNNPWYGVTGSKHPRYGKVHLKGTKVSEERLNLMWDGFRKRLKNRGLPYSRFGHPLKGVKRPDFSGENNPNWLGGDY